MVPTSPVYRRRPLWLREMDRQTKEAAGTAEALQEKGLSVAYAARGEGIYEQKSVRPKCSIRSKQQSLNASDDMF
jgi:hypothetical protein